MYYCLVPEIGMAAGLPRTNFELYCYFSLFAFLILINSFSASTLQTSNVSVSIDVYIFLDYDRAIKISVEQGIP